MKSDAMLPLQKKLFALLSEVLSVKVYNAVPERADFPYVVIGEDTASEIGTKTDYGDSITANIHIWSRKTSMAEVKNLIAQIVKTLSIGKISVDGFEYCRPKLDYRTVYNDPDGITRHGVVRYVFNLYQEG